MVNRAAQALGRKGGKKTGKTKRRGNSAYYRVLAAKSAAVRRAKREDHGVASMNALTNAAACATLIALPAPRSVPTRLEMPEARGKSAG
jgi:hypothetical protein